MIMVVVVIVVSKLDNGWLVMHEIYAFISTLSVDLHYTL